MSELFAAARRHAPRPDGALMGRIAADAARLAPRRGLAGPLAGDGRLAGARGLRCRDRGRGLDRASPRREPVDAVIGGAGYDLSDLMPGFGAEWEDAG